MKDLDLKKEKPLTKGEKNVIREALRDLIDKKTTYTEKGLKAAKTLKKLGFQEDSEQAYSDLEAN